MRSSTDEILCKAAELHPIQNKFNLVSMFFSVEIVVAATVTHHSVKICPILHTVFV